MTTLFDLRHVRHAFGRAAADYDRHAVLQHQVEQHLMERLDYVEREPQRALDVGCGTGRAAAALRKRWKRAQVIALDFAQPMLQRVRTGWRHSLLRVCADARALPLPDASVDVLFSNLCIQWVDDLPALFDEFRRVLSPGGYLAISTFGPDTLHELRAAWAAADAAPHVSPFIDIARLGDALLAAGFRDPVLDNEHFTLTYPDALAVMRDLKAIGATNADPRRSRGLLGRAHLRRAEQAYETYRCDDVLPATYEVIYAHAWGPEPGQPRRARGGEIATFPVERLRGSRR
ncbi:MAG TPA: malonyl-ACP O-methyltransferase BioC [Rudaea sp.]